MKTKNYLTVNLQFFAQEKTEKATPRRKQESRKKGQVAKSAEIPSAMVMLFVFLSLLFIGKFMGNSLLNLYRQSFTQYFFWDFTPSSISALFLQLFIEMGKILLPIMGIALAGGIIGNYIQIGFLFTAEPLKMNLKRLDPIEGAKKIFSLRAIVELVKAILKIVLVSLVVYLIFVTEKDQLLLLAQKNVWDNFHFTALLTVKIGIYVSLLLIVLAVLDYIYQRYDYEKNLRMSKQDIKDEMKKMEGDPQVKGKIKQRQREMAMRRMMQEVPKADVVITNPTHFAVALIYDGETMDSPKVVAKGADHVALKIKEIAQENDVVVMENKPLAKALFQQVEIGENIPEDLFRAVAEILAYVYKLKGKA
ncbi:flagellar biosynthesis protein FlhB [Microaerobacter geothermalis]|uniref:flagellar biosynthesis protein FlhB n=1 Tax=Microaerobacter geothermalis TaxID=674972 RepID=UPI001F2534FD|nr:flagellar biosynthesis protein FlhB [Microaerobacter geothermalis]MCF6093821.1 flagellar biosynthesis protein FlhB [Microaerobacter geothermalis]